MYHQRGQNWGLDEPFCSFHWKPLWKIGTLKRRLYPSLRLIQSSTLCHGTLEWLYHGTFIAKNFLKTDSVNHVSCSDNRFNANRSHFCCGLTVCLLRTLEKAITPEEPTAPAGTFPTRHQRSGQAAWMAGMSGSVHPAHTQGDSYRTQEQLKEGAEVQLPEAQQLPHAGGMQSPWVMLPCVTCTPHMPAFLLLPDMYVSGHFPALAESQI